MKSRDFCYWLQGWFELNKTVDHRDGATKETLDVIQNHLNMVFKHEIDPSNGTPEHNEELSKIHKKAAQSTQGLVFDRDVLINC